MAKLHLHLHSLTSGAAGADGQAYQLSGITRSLWQWDAVVKGSHSSNCGYNIGCSLNVFVRDGVVLREEVAGNFPPQNDPATPDWNPRGCQKGACYSHRMYDPTRLKYPLKRSDGSERGAGQWRRVTWDDALTEISDTLLDVLSTEGNEVVLALRGSECIDSNNLSVMALVGALGLPVNNMNPEYGDEHPGAALTFGKIVVSDSADNWFHADMVFVWGANPACTYISLFHFIPEARYHGSRVIVISPDYSPSSPFADLWLPVEPGSDAALALSMAQVIISRGLHKADFIREQTDLPLLVRSDNGKYLTQKDMYRGGRDNLFYVFDEASRRVVEAPYKSLALQGLVPALEGEYEVDTLGGPVKLRPVFELLKEHLQDYTPNKAARITGLSPHLIERVAVDLHVRGPPCRKAVHRSLIDFLATSSKVTPIVRFSPC